MNYRKTIYIIILIAGMAILSGCSRKSAINQNQNINGSKITETLENSIDTSDWKTYRNEEYGFEFKYPLNWYYADCFKSSIPGYITFSQKMISCNDGGSTITFLEDIRFESNLNYYKKNLEEYLEEIRIINENKFIIISGVKENLNPEGLPYPNHPKSKEYYSYIENNDRHYYFYYSYLYEKNSNEVDGKNDLNIYFTMLENFQFFKK